MERREVFQRSHLGSGCGIGGGGESILKFGVEVGGMGGIEYFGGRNIHLVFT